MFKIGQKVVHLGHLRPPRFCDGRPGVSLVKGEVYTIRDIDVRAMDAGFHDTPTIRVEEARNELEDTSIGIWEPGYHPARFRPLIERKSSTSTGFEILDDIRKRESVEDMPRVPAKI